MREYLIFHIKLLKEIFKSQVILRNSSVTWTEWFDTVRLPFLGLGEKSDPQLIPELKDEIIQVLKEIEL